MLKSMQVIDRYIREESHRRAGAKLTIECAASEYGGAIAHIKVHQTILVSSGWSPNIPDAFTILANRITAEVWCDIYLTALGPES